MIRAALFSLLVAVVPSLPAQEASPVGLWQTVSDTDGKPKGLVRIVEVDGEYQGVIEEIYNPEKRAALCHDCPGDRHLRPVLGMTIITGVHREDDRYIGGEIMDPESGRVYSCRLKPIDGGARLEVRGYIGIPLVGRTQTWVRRE